MRNRTLYSVLAVLSMALLLTGSLRPTSARQANSGAVRIKNTDIGGVVTSAKGPRRASG